MKNQIFVSALAVCALFLTACTATSAVSSVGSTPAMSASSAAQSAQSQPAAGATVRPLPATLKSDALDGCTFAASFNPKDVYLNDDGALVVHMTVYDYELFDPVEISALKPGDTIVLGGNAVAIQSIDQNEYGLISINGGIEENGYNMVFDDTSNCCNEVELDGFHRFFAVGEATVPVSQEFTLTDDSDLENPGVVTLPGDFLTQMAQPDAEENQFSAYNTTVTVSGGKIESIHKIFVP
jgi:hypothetical protein